MAGRRSQQSDDIVFHDLHGVPDDESDVVQVDLDADGDPAVSRTSRLAPDEGDDGDSEGANTESRRSALGGEDGDADEGGEGDDDRFSRKFQDRLKREQRAKKRERERADELAAENARLQKQLKQSRQSQSKEDAEKLDREIQTVEEDLEAAHENGETKKVVKLTSQLTDLKARKIAAEFTQSPDDDGDDDARGGGQDRSGTRGGGNELVTEWIEKHSEWYQRRGFERQTRLANRIDRELAAEGWEPTEDDYFEELDRRLKEKAPEVFDDDGDDARAKGGRKRSPVGGVGNESGTGAKPKGNPSKVELSREDFANMRRFGLDPSDPKVLKEYAANKRQNAEAGS